MEKIKEPLETALRNFCHVEWYEIDELAHLVESGEIAFDASSLKKQMLDLIQASDFPLDELNRITSNEFDSAAEAKKWLSEIATRIFPA